MTGDGARGLGRLWAAAMLAAWAAATAGGATYYVDDFGSDDGGPGTALQPWATLQHAANSIGAGDRVVVRPGDYTGFDFRESGTAALPVEFFAEAGARIVTRNARTPDGINLEGASHVVVDGFAVTGMPRTGVRSVTAEFVTIRNVHAYDNNTWGIFTGFVDDLLIENNETSGSITQHGIYVSNSGDRPVVRNNYSWGNHGGGIQLNADLSSGGDGTITGALLSGNRLVGNAASIDGGAFGGGAAINLDGIVDSRIENNLLYDNHATGIALFGEDGATGSTGNVVVNNTIHQPTVSRWALLMDDESTGNTVTNNILVSDNASRGAILTSADSLPGLASDYNVMVSRFSNAGAIQTLAQWQASTGQDAHSLEAVGGAAALFVNPAGGDYNLKLGAVALDMGTSLGAPSVDLVGVSRPQGAGFDAGALERPVGGATADFNSDTRVDALDMAAWNGGFGTATGATHAQGDADGDQDVDGRDFLVWQQQRGTGVTGSTSVPEPAGFCLILAATLLFRRR